MAALPRCRCGRKASTFAPGAAPLYALGQKIVIDRGRPVQAWCLACAARHGWLERPRAMAATITPAKLKAPRSASTAPANGKAKRKDGKRWRKRC